MSHALFSMINTSGEVESFAEGLQQAHPEWAVRPIRKVSSNEGDVLLKIQGLMGLVSVVILLQKALGASNSAIARQVLLETLVIALVATVVGCVLGFLLAQVLGQTVFSASISLRAPVIPITIVLSLIVALVAAVIPLRRIMSIQPALVLKGE